MLKLRIFQSLALPIGAALTSGGCSRQLPPSVPQDSQVLSAAVAAPSAKAPQTVMVSPSVAVSSELADACKLEIENADRSPKFGVDQSALAFADGLALTKIGACLTTGPLAGRAVELVGRADPRGTRAYNIALGERRASSVHEALTMLGVESARIVDTSRGELDATGTDEGSWRRDRRVDIVLR